MSNQLERITYKAESPIARVLLAHGAGAGNRHPFMHSFAEQLAQNAIEVISFNFPYMQTAYETEKKRPPNTNKVLHQHFLQEIALLDDSLPLFIAGKSMGGRIATQVLTEDTQALGAIILGYPFIPPGKPEKFAQRVEHFTSVHSPVLVLQGERDTFGGRTLLEQKPLSPPFELQWVASGDHSFKPLKSSGLTEQQNISFAVSKAVAFIQTHLSE